MTVTELALLHVKTTPPPPYFLTALASAMQLQSTWHAAAFPDLPSSASSRSAVWFTQLEDPTILLTTARWPSVDAHWAWIRSAENRGIMSTLQEDGHIIAEDTELLHIAGEIFGGGDSSDSSVPLLESAVISVARMFVERGKKGTFADAFEKVRRIAEEYAAPYVVRFGWRGDVEDGAEEEEFVLVHGWESVERHIAFAETPGFAEFGRIRGLTTRVDVKHYKRLELE